MKKEYISPEISFTSFEADANIMINALSSQSTDFTRVNYSTLNFNS